MEPSEEQRAREQEPLVEAADEILGKATPFWSVIRIGIKAILRIAPLGQISLGVLALIVFLVVSSRLQDVSKRLQALLQATLHTKTEIPVGRAYTGLEAFLLLNVNDRQPNPDIPVSIENIKKTGAKLSPPADFLRSVHVVNPENTVPGSFTVHDQYLTYDSTQHTEAFFFLPAFVFPHKVTEARGLEQQTLSGTLKSKEQLIADAQEVAALQAYLPSLDFQPIDGHPVVQSYIISETGVLAIRKAGIANQKSIYSKLFSPSRFFPERAYFWQAVRYEPSSEAKFDYVSEIYIDLGGNGFVRTFCERLTLAIASGIVLCVDTEVTQGTIAKINSNLSVWNPVTTTIRCDATKNNQRCDFESNEPVNRDMSLDVVDEAVQSAYKENRQSDVFGQVAIYPSNGTGILSFTVPLHTESLDGTGQRERLLYASIDIPKFQRQSALHVVIAVASLAVFIVCLVGLGRDYHLKVKQQRDVLDSVARVMWGAPTPFAWTDARNHFVSANESFVGLLGFKDFIELKIRKDGTKRTFFELLSRESRSKYLSIIKDSLESRQDAEAKPYEIEMIGAEGTAIRVKIRAESVPFPGLLWRGLPHRFGVVLKWTINDQSGEGDIARNSISSMNQSSQSVPKSDERDMTR